MLAALVYILILIVVVGLIFWAVNQLGIPQPLNNVISVAVTIVAVLIVIVLLLQMLGMGGAIHLPPP